jgi:hypothetical protein
MVNDTEYSSAKESNSGYRTIKGDSPKREDRTYKNTTKSRENQANMNNPKDRSTSNTAYQGSRLQKIMRSPITLVGALVVGATLAYNSSGIYRTLSNQPRTPSTQSGTYEKNRIVTPKKEVDGLVGFGEIFTEGVVGSFTRPFEHVGKEGVEIINETLGEAKERDLERKAEEDEYRNRPLARFIRDFGEATNKEQ